MKDVVDFRMDEHHAVGHDPLNTIIFKRKSDKPLKGHPWFDGASWMPVRFIYRDKRVLIRDLLELGVARQTVETGSTLRSMPDDLRGARKAAETRVSAPQRTIPRKFTIGEYEALAAE